MPTELGLYISSGIQGLHCFDDMEVGDFVEVNVTWSIEILFRDQDTLYHELVSAFTEFKSFKRIQIEERETYP